MKEFLADCRDWWQLYSVRLAAAVAALVGFLTSQPDILFAVINFIPADPMTRALFAVFVGAATFLAPTVARMWPQEIEDVDANDTV